MCLTPFFAGLRHLLTSHDISNTVLLFRNPLKAFEGRSFKRGAVIRESWPNGCFRYFAPRGKPDKWVAPSVAHCEDSRVVSCWGRHYDTIIGWQRPWFHLWNWMRRLGLHGRRASLVSRVEDRAVQQLLSLVGDLAPVSPAFAVSLLVFWLVWKALPAAIRPGAPSREAWRCVAITIAFGSFVLAVALITTRWFLPT